MSQQKYGKTAATLLLGVLGTMACAGETSPFATGGEITRIDLGNCRAAYVHVFTNAAESTAFVNNGNRDLSIRYLVVGGGGSGGKGANNAGGGGSGGGGGGVCERRDVVFSKGSSWTVVVGKGSSGYASVAGASAISNGVAEIELVPGGGNGGYATSNTDSTHLSTSGAAGGGGVCVSGFRSGIAGTYASSLLGEKYGPFAGGNTVSVAGGGGGGAGTSGDYEQGGAGLSSDITGENLVYGSGGGGGGCNNLSGMFNLGGKGGERAGDGGTPEVVGAVTNYYAATAAEANSGAGGAGGIGGKSSDIKCVRDGTAGSDGVVVIRYEVLEAPCVGGDIVTKIVRSENKMTYIHIFTNGVSSFSNLSGRDLNMRYLVVGGGGSGGNGAANGGGPGGAGGGGGVYEARGERLANGETWDVVVGKGSTGYAVTAGSSVISNGVSEIALASGGGNGGYATSQTAYFDSKEGAAGAGGICISGHRGGAAGKFTSSVLGVEYGPFDGGATTSFQSGGGGGAGAPGKTPDGGEGLVSDITGVELVYGSGGGGAGWNNSQTPGDVTTMFSLGGKGGTRAGNGGTPVRVSDGVYEYVAATAPVSNSGAGGGGGLGGKSPDINCSRNGTAGADGVVVIRYDYTLRPQGLVLIFR